MQTFWGHLANKMWRVHAAYARKSISFVCMFVGVQACMCVDPTCVMLWGTSVSQWASLKACQQRQTLPTRVRSHVCACTLKPSKCSRLRRNPSTLLKRHTSSAAIFLSPSISHKFSFSAHSVNSELCFPPHIGVSDFSPFSVFLWHWITASAHYLFAGYLLSDMIIHVYL